MESPNTSYILRLPTELLGMIAKWLLPKYANSAEDLATAGIFPEPYEVNEHDDAQWKSDVAAMRLTCTIFSHLRELKIALFSEFHLYPQQSSLLRLEGLSNNNELRLFVKRFVFMAPQIPMRGCRKQDIEDIVYSRAVLVNNKDPIVWKDDEPKEYKDKLWRSAVAMITGDFTSDIAQKWMSATHEQMSSLHRNQQLLLANPEYIRSCARSLANLPNAISLIVCGGNGSKEPSRDEIRDSNTREILDSCPKRSSYLQRNFPHLDLGSNLERDGQWHKMHDAESRLFLLVVTHTIAASKITVKHFAMTQGVSFGTQYDQKEDADMAEAFGQFSLTSANIHLSDGHSLFEEMPNMKMMYSLLASSTSSLTHLSLDLRYHFYTDRFEYAIEDDEIEPRFTALSRLIFPNLSHLYIQQLNWGYADVIDFLGRHPKITSLRSIATNRPITSWYPLLQCIHCRTEKLDLVIIAGVDENLEPFDYPSPTTSSLQRYLSHEEPWTPELAARFGHD